jgi:chorismate dehydratase
MTARMVATGIEDCQPRRITGGKRRFLELQRLMFEAYYRVGMSMQFNTMPDEADDHLPRIAASSYLNTAPLIWSFQHGSRARTIKLIIDTAPARSAEMLRTSRVCAALVPVIEYARIPDSELVPGVCVGARRQVRSVVLATDGRDLTQIRSVTLDPASRTSAALVQIIFREFFQLDVRFDVTASNEKPESSKTDARLVIGDPAMRLDQGRWRIFDLAEMWHRFTGYGFVFAMWMLDRKQREAAKVDFAGARDEGLAHTDDIIRRYKSNVPLSENHLHRYLHENISYQLDDSMESGMRLFFQLAYKHDLIARLPNFSSSLTMEHSVA